MSKLGEKIKVIRERRGLSQVDIATRMNVSDRTVSAWENGTRNPKDILGLADALQVDVKELIGGTETEESSRISNYGFKLTSNNKGGTKSLRYYNNNGFASLIVNGERGEFMNQYTKLDREDKLYVIECLLDELNIENEILNNYRISRIVEAASRE